MRKRTKEEGKNERDRVKDEKGDDEKKVRERIRVKGLGKRERERDGELKRIRSE